MRKLRLNDIKNQLKMKNKNTELKINRKYIRLEKFNKIKK